jgi:hypothetical protein
MRSRVNDMISAAKRMAYTRRSNGQAFNLWITYWFRDS